MMKGYKVAIGKAQKEKEAAESQFFVLKSEKTALSKSLEEAKAIRDEVVAMAVSLRFKQERLI